MNTRTISAYRHHLAILLSLLVLALCGGLPQEGTAAEARLLWEVGKPDGKNAEFALAPNRYNQFRDDGFFVVGRSDPRRDWPYVHPGPADGWAGGRPHTFSVMFGLERAPLSGECRLQVRLLDTQNAIPPTLRIGVNGREFHHNLPAGAGDASVFGEPARGRPHQFEIAFPANLLKTGANEITLTTRTGSWMLYDWLGLQAPPDLALAPVSGTVVASVQSPRVLVERNGKLMQPVTVALRHFGEPTRARVRVEGASPLEVSLQPGQASVEVNLPAVERSREVGVVVEAAGNTLVSCAVTLKPVRKWVVYLLPHSHVDIGYTHVQTEVEQAQWKYLEMAMEAARKSATNPPGSRFKWNVEVLWAVDSYLQQATPEKRQAFYEAVRAGQVGLDALYGSMLTGLCRPEELLRMLRLATVLSERTGTPIESAMITDVPGYTWGMVPALAHSGVKYFSIGPNGGDRIGRTIAAWGDKPFWWIGPNGKDKLLVWMTGTGYYRVFSSGDNLLQYLGSLEDKDYPYDFVQVRHCLGDNGAPDVTFAETVRQWNAAHAYPKLVIATTAEMFRDFERRYGTVIPSAQGDFTPYWEDGAASSARETALNRAAADRLSQAESLYAMFNPKAYRLRDFYQAWRNVVLYDEHTWGAHNSISQPDHPFVKSQWAIKQAFALDADRQSRQILEAALAARGEPVAPPATGVNVIDVINTTSVTHPESLVVVPRQLSTAGDVVKRHPADTAALPSQRLTSGELVFRPTLNPFQSARFHIMAGSPAQAGLPRAEIEGNTLVTRDAKGCRLALRVDEKTGAIASILFDGAELAATSGPTALNDYFYLPGSDLKALQRSGPARITPGERGPLVASLIVESAAPGCRKLTREIRVHAIRHYVEIINTVDKSPVRTKEGVHFGFGFNLPGGGVRMDVPWGVVRPEVDQLPGACRNWFTVQRWVDVANDQRGVTLLTPDAPLMQVGGITANLIGSLSGSKLWIERLEPSQTVYAWVMNNHWHTNYRAEQEGPTVFRFYLMPRTGVFEADAAARLGMELAQPLIATIARGSDTPQPVLSGLPSNVLVTALKPSDDGKGLIVRLFETAGRAARPALTWASPAPAAVWFSDNSERPLRRIEGAIEVQAWSIVTLRAEWPQL